MLQWPLFTKAGACAAQPATRRPPIPCVSRFATAPSASGSRGRRSWSSRSSRGSDVAFSGAALRTYDHRSDNSKKRVTLNFCGTCGTTLYLELERFPDILGLCGGTFDDPNWFERSPATCRHIFTRSAQIGVVLPAGLSIYQEHALALDGTSNEATVLAHALAVSREA